MNNVQRQNEDGAWEKAEPLSMQGWMAQLEIFFYRVHLKPLGRLMARWDERGLGK